MSFYTNVADYLKNTQSLNPAIILDMCRLDEDEDALPELEHAAVAGDIVKGKDVVDGIGDLLTGTREVYELTVTTILPDASTGTFFCPAAFTPAANVHIIFLGAVMAEGFHYEVAVTMGDGAERVTLTSTLGNFLYTDASFTAATGLIIDVTDVPETDTAITVAVTIVADVE